MRKFVAAFAALLLSVSPVAAINYPSSLDGTGVFGTAIRGQPVRHETINNLRDAVIALETKVGINGSAITSTIDYLLTNPASLDPGHKHSGSSLQDIDASTITLGTLPDARLSSNVPLKNTANTFSALQTFNGGASFSGGATFGGTVTAAHFSGQGDLLTNIPETAITDGALLARVADNETITGNWTFSGTLTADGANITNILEANITNGTILARVGDTESITGAWTFTQSINIRSVSYIWPPANVAGALVNDGVGNLSWTAAAAPPAPGGGTGAVQFNTGGIFTGDTTNFFWDNAAKRLGLGTNTPGVTLDVAGGNIRTNQQLVSTIATGTAPFLVSSTTVVANLDADLLDGLSSAAFEQVANKDAASGYAGLTAGSKLMLSEMQEVMAIADLSDVAAKTGTGTTVVFSTSPTFGTSIVTPLVTASAGLSLTSGTGSNGDITLTPDGTGVVHVMSKLTVDGALDPTSVLLTGGSKKFGATDAGTVFLAPFADAVRAVEIRASDGTTAIVTVDSSSNRVGINKTAPQFNLDVGSTANIDNALTVGTVIHTPEIALGSSILIDTTANDGDITFTANGTGNIVVSNVLRPSADGTKDLGAASFQWNNIYLDNQVISTLATGTAPFVVASTTKVANLNADLIEGIDITGSTGSGTTLVLGTSPSFTTSIVTPQVANAGALLITTTAAGDITLTPNAGSVVNVTTGTDYSDKAVCYVNSSGQLGHCTTSDASACTCTAN